MQIWIDVEDASGNKLGDGPITTATDWTSTRRLDQAGTFSFTMPVSDERANLLAHKRIVRCWAAPVYGEIREIGAGIIDAIQLSVDANGASTLAVTGDDLLRELANRTVGDLGLYYDRVEVPDRLTLVVSGVSSANFTCPENVNLSPDPLSYIYVKNTTAFNTITFDLGAAKNTTTAELKIQYYTAATGGGFEWQNLTIDDGTKDSTDPDNVKTLAKDGVVTFDAPDGWLVLDDGGTDYYMVRLYCDDADLTAVDFTSITVTGREPTTTALSSVMALAPAGWSLDVVTGQAETTGTVYLQLAGESVLQTLSRIAEATGEHFTLGFSGRRIRWLGPAYDSGGTCIYDDSGLTALAAVGDGSVLNPNALYISDFSRTSDSYELVTRLYPYGGGEGAGRVTLASTTRAAAAGYVLSKTSNYLERTAAIVLYGRIDARLDASEITASDVSGSSTVNASNALFDRTFEELRRKSFLQYAYSLEVIPSQYEVWPGQRIHVDYHEWVESYHSINVDEDLWVLEATSRITAAGLHTTALTVATVDYWPQSDGAVLAKNLAKFDTQKAIVPPEKGLNDAEKGTPTFISIRNGNVSGVKRVLPAQDGVYPPDGTTDYISQLVIEGGVITQVFLEAF